MSEALMVALGFGLVALLVQISEWLHRHFAVRKKLTREWREALARRDFEAARAAERRAALEGFELKGGER